MANSLTYTVVCTVCHQRFPVSHPAQPIGPHLPPAAGSQPCQGAGRPGVLVGSTP